MQADTGAVVPAGPVRSVTNPDGENTYPVSRRSCKSFGPVLGGQLGWVPSPSDQRVPSIPGGPMSPSGGSDPDSP
jgi:hypothetical protein